MRYSTCLFALAAPLAAYAAPARVYGKRADADILVFKFADVLEQLESAFYTQALAKFQEADFVDAGFTSAAIPAEIFTIIQQDEAAHSVALQAGLKAFGEVPITSCSFNFDSALTDVATMAATARVVENVGVAAYLGGATLLTDPIILGAAASILTIEARHQTILNVLSGTGSAIPQAFDIAFTPSDVLAIAGPFFSGPCDLGIPAQPTLAITTTETVLPGTLLTFSSAALNGTVPEDQLFCQMMVGGAAFAITLPLAECIVPDGIDGPVAIWITSDPQPLINNVKNRATNKQIAGPTLAYVDTKPQMLGQLARSGGAGAVKEAVTTETISPEAASSILASTATATGGAAAAEVTSASNVPSAPDSAAGPNQSTGVSPDGKVNVAGWSTVPV